MSVDTRVSGAFASLLVSSKPVRARTFALCSLPSHSSFFHGVLGKSTVPAALFVKQQNKDQLQGPKSTSVRATDSNDSGHWNFSPEWWGTQAGGWGHDAGLIVFDQDSQHGNGVVCQLVHSQLAHMSSGLHRPAYTTQQVLCTGDRDQSCGLSASRGCRFRRA